MAVVLDRAQRDAVYRFVVADLPDVGDITRELNRGNVATAQQLRRRFDEDVLLLNLLDWGERGERESYEITLPSEQAEAIFDRLYTSIMSAIEEAMSALLDHPVGEACNYGVAYELPCRSAVALADLLHLRPQLVGEADSRLCTARPARALGKATGI